jgi:leucine dehydrogenase
MDWSNHPEFDSHGSVVPFVDPATGVSGIIAIHSTRLGPAAGGCRFQAYPTVTSALGDALRLSRGMSYKNAMADLPAGGGKAVIYEVPKGVTRRAVFEALGDAVERLHGAYVTAEDVGTTVTDMETVATRTRHVAGLPPKSGAAGGDPGPWTALGVFVSIEALLDRPLVGTRVAVQGLGSVGFRLCEQLHRAGARLVVADMDPVRADRVRQAFDADVVSFEDIHRVDAEVFSPNALGAVLNADTIPELGCALVCGAANNQLATPEDGHRLWRRGVAYAPDFVANAGGIINVMAEYLKLPPHTVEPRVRAIGPRVREICDLAADSARSSHVIADGLARDRIREQRLEGVG